MKTYHITSTNWQGHVMVNYNASGNIQELNFTEADLTQMQHDALYKSIPFAVHNIGLLMQVSKAISITEVFKVPTFEEFWDLYAHKIDRPQALRFWNKLTDAEKMEVVLSIKDYDRYVLAKGIDKQYPATYINPKNQNWKNDYKALLKALKR